MKNKESFKNIIDQLSMRHGVHSVFSDFLDLCICAFSLGKMEEQYLKIIGKYEKPEAYKISDALAALVFEMTGDGSGFVDVLGQYFEENLSFGKNGQFFTPQHMCDMISKMTNPTGFGIRILDPACGSGRMLLSAAKINRNAFFYGADNDATCAKMAVINLCLNGLYGEIAWMDSLTNQYYGGWEIYPTVKSCPCVKEISEAESLIHLKLPKKQKIDIPVQEISTDVQQNDTNDSNTQQLIFEF